MILYSVYKDLLWWYCCIKPLYFSVEMRVIIMPEFTRIDLTTFIMS